MSNGTFHIEPCILVTDKLTVERAVSYHRVDLDKELHPDGSEDASWQTDRHYKNREEAKEADRVYAKARQRIRSVCLSTDVGFVCPLSKETELAKAISDARCMVEFANEAFNFCHINFRVLKTRIEPDNFDGVASLKSALDNSVAEIRSSLANFDHKTARETLHATKRVVDVLADPEARKNLMTAREEAKVLAKEISKLIKTFDGNVQNALVSPSGETLLNRAGAAWNF